MGLSGSNFIGKSESAKGKDLIQSFNPTDGQAADIAFHEATMEEVDAAAKLAAVAFGHYRDMPTSKRAEFVEAIAEEILGLGSELLETANRETGLPSGRLEGERGRTVNQLRLFAGLVREGSWVEATVDLADAERKPLAKPDLRKMLVPLGPVAVFGASNFPFAYSVAGGDTASALAAGCPVIVKAHPAHPATSELTARAILSAAEKCGMPDGVFSMVHGKSNAVSLALVKHPEIKAVGFTGSLQGGRALFDACASRPEPIPVYAEMGSINPVFILPGAMRERGAEIAKGFVGSVTLGMGQFCTNPGIAVGMHGDGLQNFADATREATEQFKPTAMLHAGICSHYHDMARQREAMKSLRVLARSGGQAASEKGEAPAVIYGVDAKAFVADEKLREEMFGPASILVDCASSTDLESVAEAFVGQLTVSIHATDEDIRANPRLISILREKAGRLIFNGFPTGVEVCASMHHGGPYPATTDSRSTSVGHFAMRRFARHVSYQSFPDSLLPDELRNGNPRKIWRLVDGKMSQEGI